MKTLTIKPICSTVMKSAVLDSSAAVLDLIKQTADKMATPSALIHCDNQVTTHPDFSVETLNAIQSEWIQSLRLFNEHTELYLWRQQNKYRYRLRVDGEGETIDHFDQTCYTIQRSPHQFPAKYSVRHYLDYDKQGILDFVDARLLRFKEQES
jgi:hypothetical protein